MPEEPNQENERADDSTGNENKNTEEKAAIEKESITFKDWKVLKHGQNKTREKSQNKPKNIKKNFPNAVNDNRNNYNNNNFFTVPRNFQGASNFFAGSNGQSCFMPPKNFNGITNYNTFGTRGNRFASFNNDFNNWDGPNTNCNGPNNFGDNTFINRFSNSSFRNFNTQNCFGNGRNRLNGFGEFNNKFNPPEGFFATDGIYRQKDFMQKPLPNPFRNDQKASQLLQEFDRSRYTKEDKRKKKGNKKASISTNNQLNTGDIMKLSEPKVYVANPNSKKDGKPYIPKPKVPEENFEISKEEKKQQWKEYRDAMKPFKNRDFYNAKRVVQRLGKMALSELDEKQIIRLANAREIMNSHKSRLSAKYANYIKDDDNSNELGELYVLKKKPFAEPMINSNGCYDNFNGNRSGSDFESGRKIVGGHSGFKGFVAGGMLDGNRNML